MFSSSKLFPPVLHTSYFSSRSPTLRQTSCLRVRLTFILVYQSVILGIRIKREDMGLTTPPPRGFTRSLLRCQEVFCNRPGSCKPEATIPLILVILPPRSYVPLHVYIMRVFVVTRIWDDERGRGTAGTLDEDVVAFG